MYFGHMHLFPHTLPHPFPSLSTLPCILYHPLDLICLAQKFLDVWWSTRVGLTYQDLHQQRKCSSLSQQLAVADSSMVRSDTGCPTPSPCQDLDWVHAVVSSVSWAVRHPAMAMSMPLALLLFLPSLQPGSLSFGQDLCIPFRAQHFAFLPVIF